MLTSDGNGLGRACGWCDPLHSGGLRMGGSYRDQVTGFVGTAVGVWLKLHGTTQVSISRLGQDGKPQEVWFDVDRLEPADESSAIGFGL